MKENYIRNFYQEVCDSYEEEYKIVLESQQDINEDWIEIDCIEWELEETIKDLVLEIVKDTTLSLEEKILKVYEFICLNYVYDDNVLYFFRTDLTDPDNIKYIPVDWYGRIIGDEWVKNRQIHNRRICYEYSRFFTKAINMLIDGKYDLEACILGLKDNTHYVTGLTGKDYSIVLDLDDFNDIKDLTRLKLGLTLKGIKILRDPSEKFKKALDNFNKGREEEIPEIKEARDSLKDKDFIKFLERVVEILNTYKLDSQGFCEYVRSIIGHEEIEVSKIWKEVKGAVEKRYSKCLSFEYNSKTYFVDSIDQTLKEVNLNDLDKQLFIFKPEENEYAYFGK